MAIYSIDKILKENILGEDQTYDKLYNRIKKLREELDEGVTAPGKRVVLNEAGLTYLRKMIEYEQNGATISGAVEQIKSDMSQGEDKEKTETDQSEETRKLRDELRRKDERIDELEQMVEWLQQRVVKFEEREERYLTGETEEVEGTSLVDRLKSYIPFSSE